MTENMKLFSAIASSNRSAVLRLLEDKIDLNRRDHVGRSPLHAAILFKAEDIAIDLIEAGARVTARVSSGFSSLLYESIADIYMNSS
jgi:ankyrin repeat protein